MAATTYSLVTGGNNGIGLDTCAALASKPNHHIFMGSRSLDKGNKALADLQSRNLPSKISVVRLDVNSDESIAAAVRTVQSKAPHLDNLVNNAGIVSFDKSPRTSAFETIGTNAISPQMVTDAFAPMLAKSKQARVVFVSSSLGSVGLKSDPSTPYREIPYTQYRMSKAAMNMLMACEAYEHEEEGFKMFAFCPGYVITDLSGEGTREDRKNKGALSSETSAASLLEIVEGKRDVDAGKFLHKDGLYPW